MLLNYKKMPPSGTGADDMGDREWKFFQSMRFVDPYIKPRAIKTSLGMNIEASSSKQLVRSAKAPPLDDFAKKKKTKYDETDEEIKSTNKLIKLLLENWHKEEQTVVQEEKNDHPYLEAVLAAYRSFEDVDKSDGLIMILHELEIIKKEYKI